MDSCTGATGGGQYSCRDEQNSDLEFDYGETGYTNYTTSKWASGTGGFSWTCPKSGVYFIKATFMSVSGTMNGLKFHLKKGNEKLAYYGSSNAWTGTMPVIEISTIVRLNKNDIISPYIHTDTAGVVVKTDLYYAKIR